MAKQVTAKIKLQVPVGQATTAPPVGPALGQHGVNIGEVVQKFNAATSNMQGTVCPVEISVYADRSFDFICKSPPAAELLKKAAGIVKGANDPSHEVVATVSRDQVREIAETKKNDLTAASVDAAIRIIEGTARSMGIDVVD